MSTSGSFSGTKILCAVDEALEIPKREICNCSPVSEFASCGV